MKLELEVLASTSIKRKKPWPKIVWIGEEHESLLLLDSQAHRISTLYVPSGKTKRTIPKVAPFIEEVLILKQTRNGRYLVGLLPSGDLFVWHKDEDVVKTIQGLSKVLPVGEIINGPRYVFPSDDCRYVLLVCGANHFLLWEMAAGESIFKTTTNSVRGTWYSISVPDTLHGLGLNCRECSVDAVFYSNQVLGRNCQCSVVYNKGYSLCITSLFVRFYEPADRHTYSLPSFNVEWSGNLQCPLQQISASKEPINSRGSYVTAFAHDGHVIAVAANQMRPAFTRMVYVSPLTDTILVTDMKGCGVRDASEKKGRHCWVADMTWTSDSLFLACILKSGSVCLMSRLGEPLVIQSFGHSVDMGPSYFLPLHPRLTVSGFEGSVMSQDGRPVSPSSVTSEQDQLRQRFSVTAHPTIPLLLFSDGYMVTVAQLPEDINCMTLMRNFVLDSAKHLKMVSEHEHLDLTVADAYRLPSGNAKSSKVGASSKGKPGPGNRGYKFEEVDTVLNSTQDSDISVVEAGGHLGQFGAMQDLPAAGKIDFGEPEIVLANPDSSFSGLDAQDFLLKHLEAGQLALLSAWQLAVSYPDPWTLDVDNTTRQVAHNIFKLFAIFLDCPSVEDVVQMMNPSQGSPVQNLRLFTVVKTYKKVMELLKFDTVQQHMLPVALKLIHKTASLIMNSKELQLTDPRIKTLSGCYAIMKYTEKLLNQVYVWVPKAEYTSALTPELRAAQKDRFEPAIMVQVKSRPGLDVQRGLGLGQGQDGAVALDNPELAAKRLCSTWKLLHKCLLQHQSQIKSGPNINLVEAEQLNNLIFSIQQTLQDIEGDTPRHSQQRISAGDRLSLEGNHTWAVDAWKDQLKVATDQTEDKQKLGKLLHSVLYTYILRGELGYAVEFVDNLILQANVTTALDQVPDVDVQGAKPCLMTIVMDTLKSQGSSDQDMVPCIRDRAIRQLVQSMARFMAAYFSNQTLFIYPPHNPQTLPSIHMDTVLVNNRIIPKYHEEITNIIRKDGLSGVWTTERTVEYLLLSGLVCETVWFADKMGDWKTAFLLSVGFTAHKGMAPLVYETPKKPLMLPASLTPQAILQQKLGVLIHCNKGGTVKGASLPNNLTQGFVPIDEKTNIPQLTGTLHSLLTAGVLCDVEVVPWLLGGLVDRLKSVVSNFQPLVPQDFYLPAPPLYCPQPTNTSRDTPSQEVTWEKQLRFQVSSLTQLILVVLNASHLSLPVTRWYIQELFPIQEKASKFKATTEEPCLELPEVLQQYKILRSAISDYQDDPSISQILASFRDFCSILWLLHARDKLSQNLRQREKYLSELNYEDYMRQSHEGVQEERWSKECFSNLRWAIHLLAFSRFLPDESCIYKVVLSLLMELRASEDTADILAEHFYNMENLDGEVQEKLDKHLSDWQGIFLTPEDDGKSARQSLDLEDSANEGRKSVTFLETSPRGKTLSVYFHRQCEVVGKVLKKKRKCFGHYDEFVFSSTEPSDTVNGILIGSRPFETKRSYIEFLDTFFDISFSKLVEAESQHDRRTELPLLRPFAGLIGSHVLQSFATRTASTKQHRQGLVVMASSPPKFSRSQSESNVRVGSSGPGKNLGSKQKGLFRSVSSGDANVGLADSELVQKYESEPGMDIILEDGTETDITPGAPISPARSRPNMTGLASKFSQSEEVLYRDAPASEDGQWSLDVNFGEKYHPLQLLLDWLHVWGAKQHSLGLHWKGELGLELKPTMRINVPTQLAVLALWLLENKYSPRGPAPGPVMTKDRSIPQQMTPQQAPPAEYQPESKARRRRPRRRHRQDAQEEAAERKSPRTSPSRSLSPQRRSPTRDRIGHPSGIPSGSLRSLKSSSGFDEESREIQTAYEKILNGHDDSSSLEVSSLNTDEMDGELKQTWTFVRGASSPNRTRNRSNSPNRMGNRGKSPNRTGSRSRSNSPITRENTSLNRMHQFSSPVRDSGTVMTPVTSTPNNHSPERRTPRQEEDIVSHQAVEGNPGGGVVGGDLAQQLQNIVRGELRRIMEVQHHSILAMMGAIDGSSQPYYPPPWQPSYPMNQQPSPRASPRQRSPSRGSSLNEVRDQAVLDGSQSTMVLDELHQSPSRGATHGSAPGGSVRGILKELRNLQDTASPTRGRNQDKRSKSPSGSPQQTFHHNKENYRGSTLQMSALQGPNILTRSLQANHVHLGDRDREPMYDVGLIPRFLRIPAEKDTTDLQFKLPRIPLEAWTEEQSRPSPHSDMPKMPLLNIESKYVPSNLFPGVHRGPSMPLPNFVPPTFGQNVDAVHGEDNLPRFPACMSSQGQNSAEYMGMPLLRLPVEEKPFLQPRGESQFGKLVPSHLVIAHEQEIRQKEHLRRKHAREFHLQQVENLEELEKQKFGENLLHVNLKTQRLKEKHHTQNRRQRQAQQEQEVVDRRSEQVPQKERRKVIVVSPGRKVTEEAAEGSTDITETGEEETDEDDEEIHDGYAIRPGAYEGYLPFDKELGTVADTNARIQYKTAMKMKELQKKRKKVDFSTMTQEAVDAEMETDIAMELASVRTAEAATSITKDTGVDPIQEALIAYNQARQGNMLPPDIYLGLRFGDKETEAASGVAGARKEGERGRAFINVVDVDASAIFRDLQVKPEREERLQEDLGFKPTSVTVRSSLELEQAERSLGVQEDAFRMSLEPKPVARYDSVTVGMFDNLKPGKDKVSVAVMPRDSLRQSKTAVIRRLQEMNEQMKAIDDMSNNIEQEFQNSRLLMHTIESMGEALAPTLEEGEEGLTTTSLKSGSLSETLTPQISHKSPTVSARVSARISARSRKSASLEKKKSQEISRVSGFSGVSDVIEEMVARGDIDWEEAGITKQQAERIRKTVTAGARESEQTRISLDKLRQLGKDAMGNMDKRDPEQQEQLQQWMADKRAQRMEDYKRKLQDLREQERHPFQPKEEGMDTMGYTTKELEEAAIMREQMRKAQGKENMNKRLQETENLLGALLADKPKLPEQPMVVRHTPKDRTKMLMAKKEAFGKTKTVQKQKTVPRTVTTKPGILKTPGTPGAERGQRAVFRDLSPTRGEEDQWRERRQPQEYVSAVQVERERVPRLQLGHIEEESFLEGTGITTGEFEEYTRAVQDMEMAETEDRRQPEVREKKKPPAGKPFKPKPFTELVRLQRPEILRNRAAPKLDMDYDDEETFSARTEETPPTSYRDRPSYREMSLEERQKVYGSKRIPGERKPTETTPRRVQTYAERLQELKSGKTYSTPIVPRTHVAGMGSVRSMSTRTHGSSFISVRSKGPPHKPLTYVERLQKLNAGTHKPRGTATTVIRRPVVGRPHKPPHKPKTYVEQLQALQPQVPKTRAPEMRSRPYADPYSLSEKWEKDSDIVAWSVDEDVRRLLYADEESSVGVGGRASQLYASSEGVSDYFVDVMGDGYVGSVDVDEIARIADAVSVSSGSVIDWDAVDELTAAL